MDLTDLNYFLKNSEIRFGEVLKISVIIFDCFHGSITLFISEANS